MKIKYSILPQPQPDGMKYILDEDYVYYSSTFNRTKTLKKGMRSDGATKARDLGKYAVKTTIWMQALIAGLRWLGRKYLPLKWQFVFGLTDAWFIHDAFCEDPFWDDGYPITNFIASMILCMRLHDSRYWLESYTWFFPTFFFGGKYIKEVNGWFWIKEENNEFV